jgi:hypothetical protein
MSRKSRALLVGATAVVLLAIAADASAQCAMCRLSLGASADGQRLAAGLRGGIFILLAAPFSVFAVVAGVAWRISRMLRPPAPPEPDRVQS